MKIALTLVAVAASGLFAAGDRQLQPPTKLPEAPFSTPPVADVAPVDAPMPTDLPDPGVGTSSCGCGGASPAAGQEPGGEWDIDPCVVETDEEVDIPSGAIDGVR
jgi:hypothetical protein